MSANHYSQMLCQLSYGEGFLPSDAPIPAGHGPPLQVPTHKILSQGPTSSPRTPLPAPVPRARAAVIQTLGCRDVRARPRRPGAPTLGSQRTQQALCLRR